MQHPWDITEDDVIHVAINSLIAFTAEDMRRGIDRDITRIVKFELRPEQARLAREGRHENKINILAAAWLEFQFFTQHFFQRFMAFIAFVQVQGAANLGGEIILLRWIELALKYRTAQLFPAFCKCLKQAFPPFTFRQYGQGPIMSIQPGTLRQLARLILRGQSNLVEIFNYCLRVFTVIECQGRYCDPGVVDKFIDGFLSEIADNKFSAIVDRLGIDARYVGCLGANVIDVNFGVIRLIFAVVMGGEETIPQ